MKMHVRTHPKTRRTSTQAFQPVQARFVKSTLPPHQRLPQCTQTLCCVVTVHSVHRSKTQRKSMQSFCHEVSVFAKACQTLSNPLTLRLLLGFSAEIHKLPYEQSGNLNT